jgi:glucokinase
VDLLNDLEAMALGAGVLGPDETIELQRGVARDDGNAAVIAAGTGLGQAYLHRVDGRLTAMASEGGLGDFAARTDRELALVRMLRDLYGRAEVEHVLSGPGLLNLHRCTHYGRACDAVAGADPVEAPARVSISALEGRCAWCVEALSMFVEAYGAEAGNLALRGVATSACTWAAASPRRFCRRCRTDDSSRRSAPRARLPNSRRGSGQGDPVAGNRPAWRRGGGAGTSSS